MQLPSATRSKRDRKSKMMAIYRKSGHLLISQMQLMISANDIADLNNSYRDNTNVTANINKLYLYVNPIATLLLPESSRSSSTID